MRLTWEQVEELADLAEGSDVIIDMLIDHPGSVMVRLDPEGWEARIDANGTVLLKEPSEWVR